MRQDPIPAPVADRLSIAARRLRAARRTALDRVAVEDTEWEYAGRTWSWPAGEARTYFHELAPGEREVLDDLIAELNDLTGATEPNASRPESEPGAEVVGFGTGRVAVGIPESIRWEVETTGEGAESTPREPDVTGNGSDVTDAGSRTVADDPLVAKLARYGPSAEMGDGRLQNRRERRIWSAIGSHPFLPVLDGDGDGDWIVMPRADVPPDEAVREEALDRMRAALAPYRDRFHFDELKPENVGAYRGRFWVVDYGRPWGEPLFVEPPSRSDATESGSSDERPAGSGVQKAETAEFPGTNPGEERQDRSSEN
ncbi:MAG: hypothetical protein R6U01_14160 [Halorubrum sp.]|uniref:hypothetical protein n=1 Tax=Halorubrum sp. TaxID=1879286 RepID=UPI0039707828